MPETEMNEQLTELGNDSPIPSSNRRSFILITAVIALLVLGVIFLVDYFGVGTRLPADWPVYLKLEQKEKIISSQGQKSSESGKNLAAIQYTTNADPQNILIHYRNILIDHGYAISGEGDNGEILFVYGKNLTTSEDVLISIDTRAEKKIVSISYLK